MSSILIAYYSFSKSTEDLALEIALLTNGELREIIPQKAYSFDCNTAAKEVRAEIQRGFCPALLQGNEPIDRFDTVFIGTPNCFKIHSAPGVVISVLE